MALRRCKAWAVGSYYNGSNYLTRVERWNGTVWTLVPSPNPAGRGNDNILNGVAVTSPANAWAVGHGGGSLPAEPQVTLVLHWDGSGWRVQKSPNPGGSAGYNYLSRVAATSSTNAWAVGYYSTGAANQTLVEHWDGTAWKVQMTPNPGGSTNFNELTGVAATSANNAWAVGYYENGTTQRTLVEHWNGTAWKVQNSPNLASRNYLEGVAATSSSNAWAVGSYGFGSRRHPARTLVLHWNGKAWKVQKTPNPAGSTQNVLVGVVATSPTDAWAVGSSPYYYKGGGSRLLIEHWNGTAWKLKPSPIFKGHFNYLGDVAASSRTNVWAVGGYNINPRSGQRALALHWDGTAWSP